MLRSRIKHYNEIKNNELLTSDDLRELYIKHENDDEYDRLFIYSALAAHPQTPFDILLELENNDFYWSNLILNYSYPQEKADVLLSSPKLRIHRIIQKKKIQKVKKIREIRKQKTQKEHIKQIRKLRKLCKDRKRK